MKILPKKRTKKNININMTDKCQAKCSQTTGEGLAPIVASCGLRMPALGCARGGAEPSGGHREEGGSSDDGWGWGLGSEGLTRGVRVSKSPGGGGWKWGVVGVTAERGLRTSLHMN